MQQQNKLTNAVVQYFEESYFRRADIPTWRVEHSTLYMKGYVYWFGGYNDDGILKQVEIYDMNNDLWIPLMEMKQPRYRASLCKFDENFIYLFGGCANFDVNPFWNIIEKFNIWDASSEVLSVTLPKKLSGMAWVQKDETSILVMGGNRFSVKNKVYKFNTKKKEFKHLNDLPKPVWSAHPPYIFNNKVYIFGSGSNEDSFPDIVCFNFKFS